MEFHPNLLMFLVNGKAAQTVDFMDDDEVNYALKTIFLIDKYIFI